MKTSRRIVVATAAVAAFASGAGIAFAAWSTTNGGSGTSQAVTVTAPGAPTANGSSTATTIPIQWTAGSVGGATVSYWVQRADFNGSTYSDACSSTQASPITATSCTDSGLASSHDYQYKVTVIASNWQKTGGVSDKLSTAAQNNTFHVSAIEASNKRSVNPQKWATAVRVTISDQDGNPLVGVTGVAGTLKDASNNTIATLTCAAATDSSGRCVTGDSGNLDKGTQASVTFTPSGSPAKTNYSYNSAANSPSSLTIAFP